METCNVTYTWTKKELLVALQNHYQTKLRPGIVVAINIVVVLLSTLSIFVVATGKMAPGTIVNAALIITLSVYWLFLRRQVNEWFLARRFGEGPTDNAVIRWHFSEEEVTQECIGLSSSKMDWRLFTKVLEAGDGFLLYATKMIYWLPFAAFETLEGIEQFRTLVSMRQIPYTTTKGR